MSSEGGGIVIDASRSDSEAFMRQLRAEGYESILIGGLAIKSAAGFGGTRDVDVLVSEREFPKVSYIHPREGSIIVLAKRAPAAVAGFFSRPDGERVRFDVMSPSVFVGPGHTGAEFYRWVRRSAAKETSIGRVADPAVVYYTRLLGEGSKSEHYLLRIKEDLDAGIPRNWVEGSLEIAERFGTTDVIGAKLAKLSDLEASLRPDKDVR